ncbi:MAG: PKD domain-containing protein, partial [Candidatus Bathyarchaeia archaeon]
MSIDSLKSIGDPFEFVDWHYYVSVLDSGVRYSVNSSFVYCFEEKYVNEVNLFQVVSRYVRIYIDLVDEDILSRPDLADISSHPGGGKDNYEDFSRDARFTAIYDVKTDRLIDNDEVTLVSGYYVTSGDYDGSTNVDENDAELWFRVWDDYEFPIANAGPDKYCYTGEEVTFDGMGSVASNGSSIVKYEWDLDGDGEFEALGATQTLSFHAIGQYSVSLRVTDTLGETAVDACEVSVEEAPPVASFTVSPEEPTVREAVHFTDTSAVYRGDIRAWRWDFGDGRNSTEQNPTHLYYDKGTYLVSLTVEDDEGRVNTSSASVMVVNLPPVASFTFSPREPMKGADVRFSDESMD